MDKGSLCGLAALYKIKIGYLRPQIYFILSSGPRLFSLKKKTSGHDVGSPPWQSTLETTNGLCRTFVLNYIGAKLLPEHFPFFLMVTFLPSHRLALLISHLERYETPSEPHIIRDFLLLHFILHSLSRNARNKTWKDITANNKTCITTHIFKPESHYK